MVSLPGEDPRCVECEAREVSVLLSVNRAVLKSMGAALTNRLKPIPTLSDFLKGNASRQSKIHRPSIFYIYLKQAGE